MAKFTQGKWKVLYGKPIVSIVDEDNDPIQLTEANARLIVAAPEMYELLKEELIPTSDYGGTLSFSREAKLRELFTRIDGKENE